MKAAVILEVMWDNRVPQGQTRQAPRHFHINPKNHSGKKLHRWLEGYDFQVTNACSQVVASARDRGTPDPVWLHDNLARLYPLNLLLVCGSVAYRTLDKVAVPQLNPGLRIIYLPHPAFRSWTKEAVERVRHIIANEKTGYHISYKDKAWSFQPVAVFTP